MNMRYAVVGGCFVAASILMIFSVNSHGSKDDCRNWSARSVTQLFTPCVAKAEVVEPLNIGTPAIKQKDGPGAR